MQPSRRLSDQVGQSRLHIHMHIFERTRERELTSLRLGQYLIEAGEDGAAVGWGENALVNEHRGMGLRAGDVLDDHALVDVDGRIDRFHRRRGARVEPASPHTTGGGRLVRFAVAHERVTEDREKEKVMVRPLIAHVSVVAAIVMITGCDASTDAAACADVPEALERLDTSRAGLEVPGTAFLENGETARTLADFRGEGAVLNFWATWCAPCVREMPNLDRLAASVADDGITVLALSADRAGAPVVEEFYRQNDINTLAVMLDEKGGVARAFEIPGLPTTVLIDRQGNEIGRLAGIAEWDSPEVTAYLRSCLAPPS